MQLNASAIAKILIAGEHAVLYGAKAVSLPLFNYRLSVDVLEEKKIEVEDTFEITLNGESLEKPLKERCLDAFWAISRKALEVQMVDSQFEMPFSDFFAGTSKLKLSIQTNIPVGGGLGSSASLSVALARIFAPFLNAEKIAQISMAGESIFHERPSGVDPYTIALEQPLAFQSPNSYEILNLNLSQSAYAFVLFDSGEKHDTSKVIHDVKQLKEQNPKLFNECIDSLIKSAIETEIIFKTAQLNKLGTLLNSMHADLVKLGVSTPALEKSRDHAIQLGALGAKLSGAGGGGHILALFEKKVAQSVGLQVLPWK